MIRMSEVTNHKIENVYWVTLKDGNVRLATINAVPGKKVYTERLVNIDGVEYRTFDPYKSKLGAAIMKKMENFSLQSTTKMLYLGAASGTTVSHISDMIPGGEIYAIEFSARSIRDLLAVAEQRTNIVPILADARNPETYSFSIPLVDIVYEDVAQPIQTDILKVNVEAYLKQDGYFYLAVKARSIDVTKDPKVIFEEVKSEILSYGWKITEVIDLEPYEKDHIMIVGQKA